MKKITYILTALLIAAIVGLLIWATASEAPGEVSSPPESGGTSGGEASGESGAASESLPPAPDVSESPSETPPETSEDAEEAYAQRVGKEYRIDMTPYLSYVTASDEEYLRLVNQTHLLSSDYVPEDLTDCIHTRKDGRDMQQLRLYAAKALEAFLAEAAEYGYTDVTVTSAYRSYAYQNYLFNFYCEQERASRPNASTEEIESIVLTYSLKAGMSEHQSGLCVDMHNLSQADVSFGDTAEAKWQRTHTASDSSSVFRQTRRPSPACSTSLGISASSDGKRRRKFMSRDSVWRNTSGRPVEPPAGTVCGQEHAPHPARGAIRPHRTSFVLRSEISSFCLRPFGTVPGFRHAPHPAHS